MQSLRDKARVYLTANLNELLGTGQKEDLVQYWG